jgi:hypothetical protein
MADSLSKAVKRLKSSSAELNELSNKANQTIEQVEDFLRSNGMGIKCSVPLGPKEGEPTERM